MAEDTSEKKVWRFACDPEGYGEIDGTFVASQDEIDWIVGQDINFGDAYKQQKDTIVRMKPEYFEILADDAKFTEDFLQNIGTVGDSPFNFLNEEQYQEWDIEFGEVRINGHAIRVRKPQPPQVEFEDQGSRVITYGITDDIFRVSSYWDTSNYDDIKEFVEEFDIILPEYNSRHLSKPIDMEDDALVIECMHVIRRKADGQLFGCEFEVCPPNGTWEESNGGKYGFTDPGVYVWLPVTPFTMTGYKLTEPAESPSPGEK